MFPSSDLGSRASVLIPRPASLAFDPPHHGPDGADLDAIFRQIAWILGVSPPIPAAIGVSVDRRRQAGLWGQFSDRGCVRLWVKDDDPIGIRPFIDADLGVKLITKRL